jgi:di/tricarboxylate transporter
LTEDMLLALGILGGAAVLFASNRVRSDVVAVLVVLALMLSGILGVQESLAGFADPVVVLLAALFVVGDGLVNTGIAQRLGDLVLRIGRSDETRLIALLMVTVAAVGAFMSSTAVVAVFIPVALTIAERTGLDAKRLLMPISVAALVSGMMTLIATAPNLVVDEALKARDLESLGFFGFTPFGIGGLVVCVAFMLAMGRGMLAPKERRSVAAKLMSIDDLVVAYGLQDRLKRLRILDGSPLHDRSVGRMQLRERFGTVLIGFDKGRGGRYDFQPALPATSFSSGDAIMVLGNDEQIAELTTTHKLEALPPLPVDVRRQAMQEIGAAEVMLAPGSQLIGRTLRELEFRDRYHLTVLSIRHRGVAVVADHADLRLDFGDVLLVSGGWADILRLKRERSDFVLLDLPQEHKDVVPERRRAPIALAILFAMVVAMASGLIPNVAAVLLAAVAMIATRCVTLSGIYRNVSWSTIVLVAGVLPLATALDRTGVTDVAAVALVQTLGAMGPLAMLATIFLVTTLTGLFISNTATAVIIAPIAIDAALEIGASPHAFAMTVAIASSAAFITPISTPVNMLVLEPGGYSFGDFVQVGVPLALLTMVVTVLFCAFVYGV